MTDELPCGSQAQDFFTDAKEAAADAKDAVKSEADRVATTGASRTGPRPSNLYGKDPIPSNTEDVEQWRRTHPRPARSDASDAGDGAKQAVTQSWTSAKGQTQESVDAAKGTARQAADAAKGKSEDVKGKAEDVKGKANEAAGQAKGKAEETVEGITGWAKSWFGKSPAAGVLVTVRLINNLIMVNHDDNMQCSIMIISLVTTM